MKNNTKKGIALYVAVIVSGVVTLLAVAMADIAYRQVVIAGTSGNSQHAFYIANTGIECGLYYDAHENLFPSNTTEEEPIDSSIICAGASTSDTSVEYGTNNLGDSGGESATTTFMLNGITSNPTTCAFVTVGKHEYEDLGVSKVGTILLVDGRYPCEGIRSAERSIRVRYGF